jgi:mRNA interferase MazF
MNLHPGEIWLADLGLAAKTRPIVIVSRADPDPPRALVIYVPLTTQSRKSLYEVELPRLSFLNAISYANVQGIASIPEGRLERRIGVLPNTTMAGIRRALSFALDLGDSIG